MLRTVVILDYQNVHLTAHDVFGTESRHDSLIHPLQFANAGIRARNRRQREGYPEATLSRVVAFRGLPHPDFDWEQSRRCVDQARQWRTDGAIVELRDLKYSFERCADGRPRLNSDGKKIPKGRPQEKGIDVLCALRCVREAMEEDVDLVVLASRDTDLIPALDEVWDMNHESDSSTARIETFSWFDREWPGGGSLKPSGGRRIWNTNMDRECYEAAIDRNDYR